MSRNACTIVLTLEERVELERRVRARTSTQQAALRAEIVLRAADGESSSGIAAALGIARGTVRHWRSRFASEGLDGLVDRPHQPPARLYGPQQQAALVLLACQSPATLGWSGQTHWSISDLATYVADHPELGIGAPSRSSVGRILQAHDLRLDRL